MYFILKDQHDKKSHHLKPESRSVLTSAANQIWSTYEDLQSGSITVATLSLLREKNEMFFKIIKKISERDKKKNGFDEQTARQLMNMREKEIQHFERTLCDIQYFVDICNHFPGKQLVMKIEKPNITLQNHNLIISSFLYECRLKFTRRSEIKRF